MALIKCSECGKEISSTAPSCPNCGALTNVGKEQADKQNEDMFQIIATICSVVLSLIGLCGLYYFYTGLRDYSYDKEKHRYTYTEPYTEHEQEVLSKIVIGGACSIVAGITDIALTIVLTKRKKQKRAGSQNHPLLSNSSDIGETWICPSCNQANKMSYRFCVGCGKPK